jgi:hypothetical protein
METPAPRIDELQQDYVIAVLDDNDTNIERIDRLRFLNNIYRKRSYYKNLEKERETSRARYYIRRGLPVPPKRN